MSPSGRRDREVSTRARRFSEWRRESLWFWPATATAAALVAALLLVTYSPPFVTNRRLFSNNIDDARSLLGTIAAAILTFTGVVFSITLVALQMAASQYSPRVLRTFVRKPATKLALSTFMATFVYALTVLASLQPSGRAPEAAPAGAVGLAYLLAVASLFVFVIFVNSTVRSMRVTYIIEDVSRETLSVLDGTFPAAGRPSGGVPEYSGPAVPIIFEHRAGVLDGVEVDRLVRLMQGLDGMLVLSAEVGTYLARGEPVAEAYRVASPPSGEILHCLDVAPARTLYQDARYGVRQLVDIAIRALSPAVNDPTTAVQVLDRLANILLQVVDRPDPSPSHADGDGVVRLVLPVPTWERLVELCLTEIAFYGATSPQVSRKLMSVFDVVGARAGPGRAAAVDRQRDWLVGEITRSLPTAEARARALVPDPLGLG